MTATVTNVTVSELDTVVTRAITNVHLFKHLYPAATRIGSLADFQRLPITGRNHYAELRNVTHAVSNPWEMIKPVAPFTLGAEKFPLTVLHSHEDKKLLDQRLEYLLTRIDAQPGERITILAGTRQIYVAADLAESLISLRHACRVVLQNSYAEKAMHDVLERLNSRTVVYLTESKVSSTAFPSSVCNVVTINHTQKLSGRFRHFDVLHLDEIPFIGVKEGEDQYRCVKGHFFVEYDSDGRLILTTLKHQLMPFIRYSTPLHETLLEEL